ncbi:MAG TPA: hypothetical protein VJ692_10050 [Nitrospiraceae bacterium]|nr:hypothetical protein [Nitrospiraceae bacterium]
MSQHGGRYIRLSVEFNQWERIKQEGKAINLFRTTQAIEKFLQDIADEKNPVTSLDVRAKCTDKPISFIDMRSPQ